MASIDDLVGYDAGNSGVTVDDLVGHDAAPAAQPPMGEALSMGALRGAADVGNTVLNVLDKPAQFLENRFGTLGGPSVAEARQNRNQSLQQYQQEYGGSTPALIGRIGSSVAMTAPLIAEGGAAANPLVGNTLAALRATRLGRYATNALIGAGQGGATAAMTSGGYNDPNQIRNGLLFGGALGAAAGPLRDAGGAAYRSVTGAGSLNPMAADLARSAVDKFGIPVRGSQITNSKFVKIADSLLSRTPMSGMAASDENIARQFNKAAASTIGADSEVFTPEVVQKAKQAIGQKFDTVAAKTNLAADNQFLDSLNRVKTEAAQVLPQSELQPILAQIKNVSESIENGTISGKTYQALTRKGAPLDRAMDSSDPNIAHYASKVREALDDALERSAPQDMRDMLKDARYQWKNYVTLKPLIAKAKDGEISPALLLNRVQQVFGNMDTGGGGDLGTLARIGQQFIKKEGTSNTAEHIALGGALGQIPLAIMNPSVGLPAMGATAATLGAGRAAASALKSDWYRNMLLNAVQPRGAVNPLLAQAGIPLAVETANSPPLLQNAR